ncbi:MAG: hypothetical protein K9K75_00285 [Deltaproteobacteria bacterium]|nr:hypothetical protein [Deltaproteobacteria bacterium]
MSFSERYGYKPIREIIQIESMDGPLRNGLWSLLKLHVWDHVHFSRHVYGHYLSSNQDHQLLCKRLWLDYFKEPLDQLGNNWTKVLEQLRRYFFDCEWYEAYDFIEFVANNFNKYQFPEKFTKSCNALLEKEMSAYRFVDGTITRITEQHEVAEIELALEKSAGPVRTHLRRALELLSDRGSPDYRNSIKESISAVESFVAITTGQEKGTLGQLIKKLETDIGLHPALKTAFSSLYGYTSDEGGIRHAMTELEKTDFNDAKFMLVVCSAFINFVEGKIEHWG